MTAQGRAWDRLQGKEASDSFHQQARSGLYSEAEREERAPRMLHGVDVTGIQKGREKTRSIY